MGPNSVRIVIHLAHREERTYAWEKQIFSLAQRQVELQTLKSLLGESKLLYVTKTVSEIFFPELAQRQ